MGDTDAPRVLRKGALVRVAGDPDDDGAQTRSYAFLDVRFPDGHVERWVGPGRVGTMPDGPDRAAALQTWAVATSDMFAFDIACDVARQAPAFEPQHVNDLPCGEVVIEWRAEPLRFD